MHMCLHLCTGVVKSAHQSLVCVFSNWWRGFVSVFSTANPPRIPRELRREEFPRELRGANSSKY